MADERSFDTFYAASRRSLHSQLTLLTTDRERAHDVLEEAYIRAWQRWDRVCGLADPEAWVRTLAWRLASSRRRRETVARRGRQNGTPDDVSGPESAEQAVDLRTALSALSKLPDGQRLVLVLHELCDLPLAQVAEQAGLAPSTVKARLTRGRAALATILAAQDDKVRDARPHQLLTRAASEVADPHWIPGVELRATGRRRARRRRSGVTVAALTAAVVVAALWVSPDGLHRASPVPVLPNHGCLSATRERGLVGSPYSVIVGGRQLVKVDLASGIGHLIGSCTSTVQTIVPVRGARVVSRYGADGSATTAITNSTGLTLTIVARNSAEAFAATNGGLIIARQTFVGAGGHLDFYGINGARLSTLAVAPVSAVLPYETAGGVAAFAPGSNTRLVLLNPTTGLTSRIIGFSDALLGADQNDLAWLAGELESRLVSDAAEIPLRCIAGCPPLEITDAVTGQTHSYPPLASGQVFTAARFSPDGHHVALTTADVPNSRDHASVTVLNLQTGARITVNGIRSASDPFGPAIDWSPDGRAVVIADTTSTQLRVLVWDYTANKLSVAATLVGDTTGTTLHVIGPTLDAWK